MIGPDSRFDGLRVLLVEDDISAGFDIVHTLAELGCIVITAHNAEVNATANLRIDIAVIDDTSYALADALAAYGIPFIFITGCGPVDDRYRHVPLLKKPFSAEELLATMYTALWLDRLRRARRLSVPKTSFARID